MTALSKSKIFVSLRATAASLAALIAILVANPATAIDVREVISPGGIKAWLVEHHANPIISMNFSFTGGSAHDPEGKEGLANLVSATLDEGAGDYDSQALRKILEDESISLSFTSGARRFYGSLQTLTDTSDLAFELMRISLTEPRFDDEPVARMKRQISNGIASSANRPATKAGRLFRERLYGDHPFARDDEGTIETVAALTSDDLRGFMKTHLSRDGLIIGVVGDITAEELATRLDVLFGSLPETSATDEISRATPQALGMQEVIKADQPQSLVYFAHEGLTIDDPDFLAAMVVDHILGGSQFSSRLYLEIREKRGLTYGVSTSLSGNRKAPLMSGGMQADNTKVAEAIALLRQEWRRLAEEGPTQSEVDDAINYITGSYALHFSSTKSIASVLVGLQVSELPADYPDKREALFRALTLEDIQRVAKRMLREENLLVVIAGDPQGL